MSEPVRLALCPGSFDPVTVGHEDIVRRALRIADRVVVAVAHQATQAKQGLFTVPERLELIRAVFADEPRVEAAEFRGLLVEFARSRGATLIVRGVRDAADLGYELRMAQMNRSLGADIETVFLASAPETAFVSASLVREIARLGGDVDPYLPAPVRQAVARKVVSR